MEQVNAKLAHAAGGSQPCSISSFLFRATQKTRHQFVTKTRPFSSRTLTTKLAVASAAAFVPS